MTTRNDCIRLMALIKANYPMYHAKTDKETQLAAVEVMAMVLQDLPLRTCEVALLHYMSEPHEYPPSAGRLRDIALKLHSPFCVMWLRNMCPAVMDYHEKITREGSLKNIVGGDGYDKNGVLNDSPKGVL